MKLSFHGADRGVTGSCHLLEAAGKRILVDCGLFQGGRRLDEENAEDFGFDARKIDLVLLTHAHLDHCGRLPLLVKRGFRGEIVSTSATRDLTRLVLLDAAHLQEEEARSLARRRERRGENHRNGEPLYSLIDATNVFDQFGRAAAYGEALELPPGLRVKFFDAGHILGSASVLVEVEEGGAGKKILFSGDIGNYGRPLLRDPDPPANVDVVVMETTYGDRLHRSLDASIMEFYEALNTSFRRGGNVVIPTFALERAQELLFYLREGVEQNKLPPSMQVFLDSPMAISATEIFRKHPESCGPEVARLLGGGVNPFEPPGLHFCRESAESIALNSVRGGAVIMAGSGMCTGGRVRHHLRHNLGRADSSVIFVGFAAQGTLGRQIVDGASAVSIFGEPIVVRAHIHTINGFSAHADQAELLAWRRRANPARTFLVHGEEASMRAFAEKLGGAPVELPQMGEAFEL
jgi:metallo-beta-lactamase family protein